MILSLSPLSHEFGSLPALHGWKSVVPVTWNVGEPPATFRSRIFVSPSCANASSRMWSIRSESPRSLAAVKSQAR